MKSILRLSVLFMVLMISTSTTYAQGTTTGSFRGQVSDVNGEPLIGVNIVAIHGPSGVQYGTTTDLDGYYNLANLRVGGPYTITASYVGYQDRIEDNIYLRLGERQLYNFSMSEDAVTLGEVTIVASAANAGTSSGTSTKIGTEQIDNMPTLDRNLNDFTRLTPQAKETFDGGFSIAGINNRYNAIYIDGAVNNDVFGLADQGTNGGQTGTAPFSVDILDQIQVVISPYDVSLGGFAGGGINAVTRSGTNNFEGTAYYFLQNESLVGKTNGTFADRFGIEERESVAEFAQKTFGASLGGPIIKNKAFFFVNAEIQDDVTPRPFDIAAYEGNTDEAGLNQLSDFLQSRYGYDAGEFGSKDQTLEGLKLFGKIDYNINNNHRLTLRHNYTKADNTNRFASTSSRINYANNGIFLTSTTNSSALELNSSFGTHASNNLIIGYTTVRDDRDPIGADFPAVRINDGDGRIQFGSEAFSTANALDQNVLTITDNFKLYKGDHTITIGTHNEFSSFRNVFIRQNFGSYFYLNLDQFLSEAPATGFDRSYSLLDGDVAGDNTNAAAEFDAMQLGFYIQDEFQVNNRLTVTAGLRLDIPFLTTEQSVADDFNTETLPLLESFYSDVNATGGDLPQGQLMWSPRLGFNYALDEDRSTILRGGLGIFTSRIPFVWPGGAYTNNGVTIGGLDEDDVFADPDNPTQEELDMLVFNPDPQSQLTNPNFAVPSGQFDLFAADFKYPQLFRTSLAIDKSFGNGFVATLEGMYSKNLNNVFYQNINTNPEVAFNWTGTPDDRPVYVGDNIDPRYNAVYLATNTNEGYTYNVTAALQKTFTNGLSASLAYTYGDAQAVFEGTSSQNSSQWRGAINVDGRNFAPLGRSDFSLGSRIVGTLNYTADWTNDGRFNTIFSVFYSGESGAPFSYVYNSGDADAENLNNERGSTGRERSLIYIPASADEINLVDPSQWEALNDFIEQDDYLSANRGSYAEKNASRAPWTSLIDVRISQDLGIKLGEKVHKFQLTLDVFNFANLLNKDWGTVYSNPFTYRLIDFEGYDTDGTTPLFSFDDDRRGLERFNIQNFNSRWRARVGIRYIFK